MENWGALWRGGAEGKKKSCSVGDHHLGHFAGPSRERLGEECSEIGSKPWGKRGGRHWKMHKGRKLDSWFRGGSRKNLSAGKLAFKFRKKAMRRKTFGNGIDSNTGKGKNCRGNQLSHSRWEGKENPREQFL